MKKIWVMLVFLFIISCNGENIETNKCDGVTCSGKGACVVNDSGKAVCNCFDGYIASDLECKSACDGIECSNHGTCKLEAGAATCECDEGYEAYGTQCLDKSDLCNGVTCSNHGTCKIVDDKATCTCDEGYSSEGTECKSICDEFDCSNHGECILDKDQLGNTFAKCECDDGYLEFGTDCIDDNSELCDGITCNDHGSCVVLDGEASCNCDDNFANSDNDNKSCVSVTTPCFRVNNEACETDITPVPSEYFYGIYPEGTELNLLLNTPISISFTTPVDLNTVENKIYLFKDNQAFSNFTISVDENNINKLIIKPNTEEWPTGKYSVVLLKGIKNKIGEEYKETKAYKYTKLNAPLTDENNNSITIGLSNEEAKHFETFRANSVENLNNLETYLSKNRSEFLISWNIEFKELFIACLYSSHVPGCENAPDYPIPSSWGMKDGHLNLVADENASDYIKDLTIEANKADGWSVTEPFRIYMSQKPDMDALGESNSTVNVFVKVNEGLINRYPIYFVWEEESSSLLIYPKYKVWISNLDYILVINKSLTTNESIKVIPNFYNSFMTSVRTLVDENQKSMYSAISDELANTLEEKRKAILSYFDGYSENGINNSVIVFKIKTQNIVDKLKSLVDKEINNELGESSSPNIIQTIENIRMVSSLQNLGISIETMASDFGYDNSDALYKDIAYTLIGNINLNNFLAENGVFDENNTPIIENTGFYLTIPKASSENLNCIEMPSTGFPVIIFAHGLNRTKEDIFALANHNAQNCYATIAIDFIKYGSRAEGVINGEGFFTTNLPAIRDNIRQSVLDLVQLRKAINKMASIEFESNLPNGVKLNNNKIYFFGMSLGGIIGSVYSIFDTSIEKLVFNGMSGNLLKIFLNSESEVFSSVISSLPFNKDSSDFKVFEYLSAIILDGVEPISYGHNFAWSIYYHDDTPDEYIGPLRRILLQKISDDNVIPNFLTDFFIDVALVNSTDYKTYIPLENKHLFILYNEGESLKAKEDMINLFKRN